MPFAQNLAGSLTSCKIPMQKQQVVANLQVSEGDAKCASEHEM